MSLIESSDPRGVGLQTPQLEELASRGGVGGGGYSSNRFESARIKWLCDFVELEQKFVDSTKSAILTKRVALLADWC